jgi:hypothetical protein
LNVPPSTAQGMQTPQRGGRRPSRRKGGGLLYAGDTGCACRPSTTPTTTTSATSSTRPPTRSFAACGRPTTGGLLCSPSRGPPPQHLLVCYLPSQYRSAVAISSFAIPPCGCSPSPQPSQLRCTNTRWNTRIAYPIRIGYGYASDTRWIRIRGVSDFYYFRKKTHTRADTYPNHGHGALGLLDTAHPNKHRISYRPSLDVGSTRIPARPPPARRDICSVGTSACRPPATGDEPLLASDEHPSLLAGAEDRPCSPVEFPRPCDVDPVLPVSKSPSPFSISSS